MDQKIKINRDMISNAASNNLLIWAKPLKIIIKIL